MRFPTGVWPGVMGTTAGNVSELQAKNDKLLKLIDVEEARLAQLREVPPSRRAGGRNDFEPSPFRDSTPPSQHVHSHPGKEIKPEE